MTDDTSDIEEVPVDSSADEIKVVATKRSLPVGDEGIPVKKRKLLDSSTTTTEFDIETIDID